MIFASDTQLYHHFFPVNFHLALARVTRDAQAVANWARANGLILNSDKTKIIIIGSVLYTRELDLQTLPRVVIDGHPLPYVTEARSLGVTFTPPSTGRFMRGSSRVKFFAHSSPCDFSAIPFLVTSANTSWSRLLSRFLEWLYASPVYHHLDDARIKKLETTSNACVRFVVGNIPRRGNVTPHRPALGWFSAARRREYAICLQVFKVVVNGHGAPKRISTLLP